MLNQLVVTLSKPSLLVLLLFYLTTLQPHPVSAQPPTKPTNFFHFCLNQFGNYSDNSDYANNLNSVLSHLKNHSSISLYYSTTTGRGENQVYAQYYCRGDIDKNLCHECVDQALDAIQRNCSSFKAAIMWFEECTLQYGNQSMAGLEAEYPRSWWYSGTNVSDPGKFGDILNNTVDRIINKSAYGNGSLHFATGEGVSGTVTVYSLVQCIPGLNGTQCETCLKSAYAAVPNCCGSWLKWAFVFFPSCQFRYSVESPFYAIPNWMQAPSLAPSPLSLLPPTPSDQPFPPSQPSTVAPSMSVQPASVQPSPSPLSPTEGVTGHSNAGKSYRENIKLELLVAAVALLMFRPAT